MTFRQDLGEFSQIVKIFAIYDILYFVKKCENYRKFSKVFVLNKIERLDHQHESLTKIYMNRFAIQEDDQFEIHFKYYIGRRCFLGKDEICNVAAEVMLKARQGLGSNQPVWRMKIKNNSTQLKTTQLKPTLP